MRETRLGLRGLLAGERSVGKYGARKGSVPTEEARERGGSTARGEGVMPQAGLPAQHEDRKAWVGRARPRPRPRAATADGFVPPFEQVSCVGRSWRKGCEQR